MTPRFLRPCSSLTPLILFIALGFAAVGARAADETAPNRGPAPFEALSFRSIGPPAGGRLTRVTGVAGEPLVYYAATASGGVWKTTDGARSWQPIFDAQPISSIGSIAVAPSDPNVVYVGSGEANIRGNVAPGNGVYKSVDAGQTWTHVWKQEGQIGALAVHPRDPDVAYAAVLGHAFGPNPQRGVYRTRDGGRTWQQVLKKDAETGASDVTLDPGNPNIVFAGLWQARRRPWEMTSGGPGSGLHVSRDGGDTWQPLTDKQGLPKGIWGKVGVRVAPSDSRRVYALIEAEEGGLFRSDDGGASFKRVSGHRSLRQRAWYYSCLTIDPGNPDVVWFPQVPMLRTRDGGRTIESVKGFWHGDHHDAWIDPRNPKRMIVGNDGAPEVSVDGGETWHASLLPISQFYHVSVDSSVPYRVMGAMQDLGTASGPSNSLSSAGIRPYDWHSVGGGEAGHVVARPDDPNIVYAGEYGGYISHYDHRTRQARNVSIYPENPSGHGGEDLKYRFQWTSPIASSPHDPKVVYHAGNVLFRSTDAGASWTPISPDLTRNDKSKQKWSGGPITGDNTGVEIYCTIFSVAESPREAGLIWAGSDDGLVHVTRDAGAHWDNVTANVPALPEWGTVSMIEPSPHDAPTAYLVVDAHRLDDMTPYLWKTSDYGRSWKRLDAGLARDVYLRSVREDPKRRGLLYVGTEKGVAYSTDDGATWKPLRLGLPTVAVSDLVVTDDDLVVGTQGRSLWIFDDLTPIREWSAEIADEAAHLFAPHPAKRWREHRSPKLGWKGDNPPLGAIVYYWLKNQPKSEVTLEVLDPRGRVIRTLRSTIEPLEVPIDDPDAEQDEEPKSDLKAEPGIQRAVWDLGHEGAPRLSRAKLDMGDPKDRFLALPGAYTLRLNVDGTSYEAPLTVEPDPRVELELGDLEAQRDFALEVRDALTRLAQTVEQIRGVREQLVAKLALWRGRAPARELSASAESLVAECDRLEGQLHNPKAEIVYDILAQKGGTRLYSRMAPLYSEVVGADGAPTQGMRDVFADQKRELEGHLAAFGELTTQIQALNQQAKQLDLLGLLVPEPPQR